MFNRLKSYRWVYLALAVVLACSVVPATISIATEDTDCCTESSCLNAFCVCHGYVVELPVAMNFISSFQHEFTLSTDVFPYSLLLVPYIFRPPVA